MGTISRIASPLLRPVMLIAGAVLMSRPGAPTRWRPGWAFLSHPRRSTPRWPEAFPGGAGRGDALRRELAPRPARRFHEPPPADVAASPSNVISTSPTPKGHMMTRRDVPRRGFAMIEVLVAISILSLLIALLIPAVL